MHIDSQCLELIHRMSPTPADNRSGFSTAVPWVSRITGEQTRTMFRYSKFLRCVARSPLVQGLPKFIAIGQNCFLENFLNQPTRMYCRQAAGTGANPDPVGDLYDHVCLEYARLLQKMCKNFVREDGFDRGAAREFWHGPQLAPYLRNFSRLEFASPVLGMTQLMAMKDLLKNLLVTISEEPLFPELPLSGTDQGERDISFPEYLETGRRRFENLCREEAFDMKIYSENATGGRIGFMDYYVVEGSQFHSASLRHYPLPPGVQPNGQILYINTPLINRPEIFDLADGKSIVQKLLEKGYLVYMVDYGEPGPAESTLGLDFYGKTLHDRYLGLINSIHPGREILAMAYCMGGTLIIPYLARRAEERLSRGEAMDVRRVALMAAPVKFDDAESGHGPMREVIRRSYDGAFMHDLFGESNIPPQVIEAGMQEIQPGVRYNITAGFYIRASHLEGVRDSAPFLYWITHGTKFPTRAHREWISKFFLNNEVFEGKYRMPSTVPHLDGKPVRMSALREAGVVIFDYRGLRDPIAPAGSCVASELWGYVRNGNIEVTRGGLNRTIERNAGHIFVVSRRLLGEYIDIVTRFLEGN